MNLLSFPDRVKPLHIIIGSIILIVLNLIINLFPLGEIELILFNSIFGFAFSTLVSILLFVLYSVSRKNKFIFTRTLLLMGFSMIAWAIGDALWMYLTAISAPTFISSADVFYLIASVLLFVSLFSIPGSLPPSRRRNMVYVEISILVLSATIIFSILLLVPGKPDLSYTPLTLMMVFIYPVLDVILIWIIMILIFTYPLKSSQKVLITLLIGAICFFFSDLMYLINSIYEPLIDDFLADTGYYIFYTTFLLAGLIGYKEIRPTTDESEKNRKAFLAKNWIIFLPGIFLIVVIGLLLVFVLNQSFVMFHGIIVILALIIILFIIHQYLVITDNISLTKEMKLINTQLENKVAQRTEELSRANEELHVEMKERKIAEDHLAKSNKELELVNMDKDKLFSILAHDLRSPMGSVMKLSELLAENFRDFDESELDEIVNTLHKSTTQTFQLLNDLLTWSSIQLKRGEMQKEMFPITEIVNENIALFSAEAIRKQIDIHMDIDEGIRVYADKFAIQTVLRNLLSNAVKFTRHQGAISIKAEAKNNQIEVSVADNGIGISKDKQKKIFRVDSVSTSPGTDGEKGTGFGLLLCKDLVELNGGELGLVSEKGKGSRFFFTLPDHLDRNTLISKIPHANTGSIQLTYDHQRRIGFCVFNGEFTTSVLESELQKIWTDPEYKAEYSVFIDLQKAWFNSESVEFPEIIKIFKSMPGQETNRRFALLTTTPQQVVYSTMFSQHARTEFKFTVEVFSTYDAALNWLGG
jgi:signal transduction histidine kinase